MTFPPDVSRPNTGFQTEKPRSPGTRIAIPVQTRGCVFIRRTSQGGTGWALRGLVRRVLSSSTLLATSVHSHDAVSKRPPVVPLTLRQDRDVVQQVPLGVIAPIVVPEAVLPHDIFGSGNGVAKRGDVVAVAEPLEAEIHDVMPQGASGRDEQHPRCWLQAAGPVARGPAQQNR